MSFASFAATLIDRGGRSLGIDRRQFSYTDYITDGRINMDRRSGIERRSGLDRRSGKDRRSDNVITMKIGKDGRKGKDRRRGLERRAAFAAALST